MFFFMSRNRFTRSIFLDLLFGMLIFGFIVGIIFPFFVNAILAVPQHLVFTPVFFVTCIIAGLLVGMFNYGLVKITLGKNLNILIASMKKIQENLKKSNDEACDEDNRCFLDFQSRDVLGETAGSFNMMISSILSYMAFNRKIKEFGELLNKYLDLKELSFMLVEKIVRGSGAEAGICLIFQKDQWVPVCSYGIEEKDIDLDKLKDSGGLMNRVLKSKALLNVAIPEEIPVSIGAIGFKFTPRHFIIYPVVFQSEVLGVIMIASMNPLDQVWLKIMSLLSFQFGNAFQNAIMHERLKEISVIDELTSAYNRRFGMQRLREEYSRTVRDANPLSVVMGDIDYFKSVNDNYGHQAGDLVLRDIAHIFKSNIREGDVLCRYGERNLC